MKTFAVTVETKGREIYYVDAESVEEARDIWMDDDPQVSEVTDAWVASIVEEDDNE